MAGLRDLFKKMTGQATEPLRPAAAAKPPPTRRTEAVERKAAPAINLTGGRKNLTVEQVLEIQLQTYLKRAQREALHFVAQHHAQLGAARLGKLWRLKGTAEREGVAHLRKMFPEAGEEDLARLDRLMADAPRELLEALTQPSPSHPWLLEKERQATLDGLLRALGEDVVRHWSRLPRTPSRLELDRTVRQTGEVPEELLRKMAAALGALRRADVARYLGG